MQELINGWYIYWCGDNKTPKKVDVTLQEIADWKGVEKELINIINE